MKFGIDVLLESEKLKSELKDKRLAILAHPASVTRDLQYSMDALAKVPGLNLCSAFGPQHGMRGEKQDNMIESEDYIDPVLGIPIFSLYGEVRRPTSRMMESFDTLLVDLQDVGTRVYTFLTTLLYILESGAEHHKAIWVLDRPNPAGRPIEGTLLESQWTSFVGAAEFPMRHGLTFGEAAVWFVKKKKIDVELKVIQMADYYLDQSPGYGWPSEEISWVNPSPNAASVAMARCYPGTVLLEGTHLSEGRGTTHPLEMMGAPDLDSYQLIKRMELLAPQWLQGCKLRPCYFQPTFQKHAGKICAGFQIHVDDRFYKHELFKPYRLIALSLKAIRSLYDDYPIWRDFHYEYEKDRLAIDLISGGPLLREWVDDPEATIADFENALHQDEVAWLKTQKELLLY